MKKILSVLLVVSLIFLTSCSSKPSSTYSDDESVFEYAEWYLNNLVETELKKVNTPEKIINACDIYEVNRGNNVNWPYICGFEESGNPNGPDIKELTTIANNIKTLKNIKVTEIIETYGNPYIDSMVKKYINVNFEVNNEKQNNTLCVYIDVENYTMTEMSIHHFDECIGKFPGLIIEFFKCYTSY